MKISIIAVVLII